MKLKQKKSRFIRAARIAGYSTLFLLATASAAFAANQVVTNCSSDLDLRNKLTTLTTGSGGTLTFNCGAATIVLSGTQLPVLNHTITIDGGGVIRLSGGNSSRIFSTGKASSVTIKNITLTRGSISNGNGGAVLSVGPLSINNVSFLNNVAQNGGAIYANSGLTISNSNFDSNSAAGTSGSNGAGGAIDIPASAITRTITNSNFSNNEITSSSGTLTGSGINLGAGTLSISLSTFTNNTGPTTGTSSGILGGGIYQDAGTTLNVLDSTFDSNSVYLGSGIFNNGGFADIERTTFKDNQSLSLGGVDEGEGSGIYNMQGHLTAVNDTFSGNVGSFGAGVYDRDGDVIVQNSTFSGNSATGLFGAPPAGAAFYSSISTSSGGSFFITDSILEKSSPAVNCGQNNSGSFIAYTFSQHNLSDDTSCDFGGGHDNVPIKLGALADNGGPTLTFYPNADSPAIDAGASCAATDQRGVARPFGDACDLGAVEFSTILPGTPTPTPPPNTTPTPTPTPRPTATPTVNPSIVNAESLILEARAEITSAKRILPPKPSKSLPEKKQKSIDATRKLILAARSTLKADLTQLLKLENLSGAEIRTQISSFSKANLTSIKNEVALAISLSASNPEKSRKLWKKVVAALRAL